jgi:hypothetical protein
VADAEAPESTPPTFEYSGTWPFDGELRIGGHPAGAVTAFDVHAPADGIPVVTLTLMGAGALRLLLERGAADVKIPDETREALIALGWKPPAT